MVAVKLAEFEPIESLTTRYTAGAYLTALLEPDEMIRCPTSEDGLGVLLSYRSIGDYTNVLSMDKEDE